MKNIVVEGQISLFDLPMMDLKPEEEFKITDEEIEEFLLKGSGFREGKKRIYNHFIKQPYNNAIFLKEEYGIGGGNCALSSSGYTPYEYNSKGVKIEKRDKGKRAEIILNWDQVSKKIEKLINENRYLTKGEKVKYGFIKDSPVPNKSKEENMEIDKIIKHYKDTCRFIVKGEYGVMIHLRNKAFFYGYDGKKTSINSSFVPPKPLGKVLVDNIGAYKKSTVLDKKVTEMDKKVHEFEMYDGFEVINTVNILTKCGRETLSKGKVAFINSYGDNHVNIAFPNEYGGTYGISISISQFEENFKSLNRKIYPKKKEIWDGEKWIKNPDKEVIKTDIKFTKGQAVKVCAYSKERLGEVWRLQSNGCISILFKDTNSIGAYPRKFIKSGGEY